jgi:hypothetical protein
MNWFVGAAVSTLSGQSNGFGQKKKKKKRSPAEWVEDGRASHQYLIANPPLAAASTDLVSGANTSQPDERLDLQRFR